MSAIVATFQTHPRLQSRVAAIDVIESSERSVVVLPSTNAVLGFQFSGNVRSESGLLSAAGVTGIQPTVRTYSYARGTGSVLVRFTPEGIACLGVPANELAALSVPLDAILPAARLSEVQERLYRAPDSAARVHVVEQFLLDLPYARDPVVSRAITMLDTPADDARVAQIARTLGLSERQLERRFRARVGIVPKRFATLRRFERAVALAAGAPSLTAAALAAGYYDQSHFIRDFRRFVGVSPRGFFR